MYHRYLPTRARNILYKYLCGHFYVLKKENQIKAAEENFQNKAFVYVIGVDLVHSKYGFMWILSLSLLRVLQKKNTSWCWRRGLDRASAEGCNSSFESWIKEIGSSQYSQKVEEDRRTGFRKVCLWPALLPNHIKNKVPILKVKLSIEHCTLSFYEVPVKVPVKEQWIGNRLQHITARALKEMAG